MNKIKDQSLVAAMLGAAADLAGPFEPKEIMDKTPDMVTHAQTHTTAHVAFVCEQLVFAGMLSRNGDKYISNGTLLAGHTSEHAA